MTTSQSRLHKAGPVWKSFTQCYITGHFNGDEIVDTLWQEVKSNNTHSFLKKYPAGDWDQICLYLQEQQADVVLFMKGCKDTLREGSGFGVYCLINLGDVNGDKRDEFAFVTERCDQGSTNTCYIYSMCGGVWKSLFSFSIHESAFYADASKPYPVFHTIPGFLEKQGGVWHYTDYLKDTEYNHPDEVGKLKKLIIPRCK